MSDYNFTDDATPDLPTQINAANEVELVDGSPQGDHLTAAYSGSTITVTVVPPSGWSLDDCSLPNNGTLDVPRAGDEDVYSFTYTVKNSSTSEKKSGSGVFKVKKTD